MSQDNEKNEPSKSFFNTKASPAKVNRPRYSKKDHKIPIKHQDEDEYKNLAVVSSNETQKDRPSRPKYRSGDTSDFKNKWKTEKCRFWQISGQCKYGEACAFAHGENEIRNRKMSASYKTKQCRQFFEAGYCTYGQRCQFSHKSLEKPVVSYVELISKYEEFQETNKNTFKRPRLKTFESLTYLNSDSSEKKQRSMFEDSDLVSKKRTMNSVNTKENEFNNEDQEKEIKEL